MSLVLRAKETRSVRLFTEAGYLGGIIIHVATHTGVLQGSVLKLLLSTWW